MTQPENRKHRKLLQTAIAAVGIDTLPGRQLEGAFKHEGNRPIFSELKKAEENYLLHAILRTDRFGNVTAGGPETIPEGTMHRAEVVMRASVAEIIQDDDEANLLINTFLAHVRATLRISDASPARPTHDRVAPRHRPAPVDRDQGPGLRQRLAAIFRRIRGENEDDDGLPAAPIPSRPDDGDWR